MIILYVHLIHEINTKLRQPYQSLELELSFSLNHNQPYFIDNYLRDKLVQINNYKFNLKDLYKYGYTHLELKSDKINKYDKYIINKLKLPKYISRRSKYYKNFPRDYGEFFEWSDGNIFDQHRIGYFITYCENGIKICQEKDDCIGVINGLTVGDGYSMVSNCSMSPSCKYLKDDFGTITGISPVYDKNVEYIKREDRIEWDIVTMFGKCGVIDNGKCVPGKYCSYNNQGIAVPGDKYKVIERISNDKITILLK